MSEIIARFEQQAKFQNEHEAEEIRQKLENLANNILIEVGKQDGRFQSTLVLSGSVYERAKVHEPDEFDFMVRLDKLSNKPTFRPCYKGDGYVKLKLDGVDWKEFNDEDGCFSPNLVCRHFKKLVNKSLSTIAVPEGLRIQRASPEMLQGSWGPVYSDVLGSSSEQNPTGVLYSETHGPATTVYIVWQGSTYKNLIISVDLTLTLEFLLAKIPIRLSKLSQAEDSTMERCGFHVVPSGFDIWRISFSMAEKDIILSAPEGFTTCYKILKILRDGVAKDLGLDASLIPSYFLKTVLLSKLSELSGNLDSWQRQFWSQRVTGVLEVLLHAMAAKRIQSYFIPGCNLLSEADRENKLRQILLEEMLNRIRGCPERYKPEEVKETRRQIKVLQVVDLLDYMVTGMTSGKALADLWNKMFVNVGTIPGTRNFGWFWNEFTDLKCDELSEDAYKYLIQIWYVVEAIFQQLLKALSGELNLLAHKFYIRTCEKKKKFEDNHRDLLQGLQVQKMPLPQIFYEHLEDLADSYVDGIEEEGWSSLHKAVPSGSSMGFFANIADLTEKQGSARGLQELKSTVRGFLNSGFVPEQAMMNGIVDFVTQIFIHAKETLKRQLYYISIPELDLD